MEVNQLAGWILTVNLATFITVALIGFKIIRFFNRIELKTDILWAEHERRLARQELISE